MSRPVLDESFDTTIIIDGLPIVDPTKSVKLIEFVKKKFAEFEPVGVDLPMVADKSLGYMFMEVSTADNAKKALAMNGKPMDKSHTFKVDLFGAPDQYMNTPETYTELSKEELRKAPMDKQEFLLDPAFRDQLLMRFDDENSFPQTHIAYVDTHTDDILVTQYTAEEMLAKGKPLTTSRAGFSPKGSYMYTFHTPGLALWAGEQFTRFASINHPGVTEVAFSPCERYLVTMSEQPNPSILCDVVVWEVATQQPIVRYNTILKSQPWPCFKWSYDGRYFGRTANRKVDNADGTSTFTPIGIAIYDTQERAVVGGKPLPAQGLVDFQFSPAGPQLAYCVIGQNSMPSRLVIYDMDKKRELRNNPSFGVERWELQWQQTGEALLVYMDRKTSKTSTTHALDIYFVNKKNIPLVEFILPKAASKLQMSPTQNKVVVTSFRINEKGVSKAEFSLFNFTEQGITQVWNETVPFPSGVPTDNIQTYQAAFPVQWSPQGDVFIVGTIASLNATLIVLDASKSDSVEILAADLQLAHGNEIKWDHDGRYFVLASTRQFPSKNAAAKYKDEWKNQIHSRFQVYNFQGRLLCERKVPRLYNIEFRPFPLDQLTKEEKVKVKASLKTEYWKKFDSIDERFERSKLSGAAQQRNEMKQKWKELKKKLREQYKATEEARKELYNGWWSDAEEEYEVVELSRVERVIQ